MDDMNRSSAVSSLVSAHSRSNSFHFNFSHRCIFALHCVPQYYGMYVLLCNKQKEESFQDRNGSTSFASQLGCTVTHICPSGASPALRRERLFHPQPGDQDANGPLVPQNSPHTRPNCILMNLLTCLMATRQVVSSWYQNKTLRATFLF